jgi:hypothetical protein
VRTAEIPVEHFISLLLPTRRWSEPAFAGFAAPAGARRPGRPARLSTPDRWWAVGAQSGALLAYCLTRAVPIAEGLPEGPVELPLITRPVEAVEEDLRMLSELMERAAPAFFAGEAGPASLRGDLRQLLAAQATEPVLPWYQGLAPDFFGWLEA